MSSSGQLLKMKLVAYDDDSFQTASGMDYEVLINPESYALTYASETLLGFCLMARV